jgi:hypothetical protein
MTKEEIQEELKKVNDAISKLQTGERILNVAYNGHSVAYASISLDDLLAQRQRLLNALADPGAKRQIIFATHKGVK